MYVCASGVIYIYLIQFCYWKYELSASVSTSWSSHQLTLVSSIRNWDMKLESVSIEICLIVIWGSKYLISKRFSLLMNDASDMNNIGSQGITGIFVIDSQVIMNEYTDFAIQAVYHMYAYFVLSTITYEI